MKKIDKKYVIELSKKKNEPKWMLDFRLNSLKAFNDFENPNFGPELDINFDKIIYYKDNKNKMTDNWDKVEDNVRDTFCDLGVIKAEQDYLYGENKYTALNGAFWSGGSFIYIPKHTKLDRPLQSYFRIDTENLGQFERTIIIVDDYAEVEYIEGCTAKSYSSTSLHAGVVEIYVGKHAKCKYSTIQNWSTDVYNLVTKRAIVEENGTMEWIDGNVGSGVTMKYPACILKGDNAVGNSISIAYANEGQVLDAGAKMIHLGKNTKSNIVSKSIALNGGVSNYRGTTKITKNATNSKATIKCDTIILDDKSKSDTIPNNIVSNNSSIVEHEATISKVSKEKLFYLMSKGLSEDIAKELLIMGFISDFKKELPLEYAVELNRLLKSY